MPRFVMSLALAEFERQLQPLLAGWAVDTSATGWRLLGNDRRVDICCQVLPALRLGAIELPRVEVSILFAGGSTAQHDDFIAAFLRYFRRGGG